MVDKVQRKLSGYDAKLLSLTGRTMLAKSVLLTIPGYFIQTAMIPIGVCKRIEQLVRQFVWGSANEAKNVALENWDTCYQPLNMGGLDLKKLVP